MAGSQSVVNQCLGKLPCTCTWACWLFTAKPPGVSAGGSTTTQETPTRTCNSTTYIQYIRHCTAPPYLPSTLLYMWQARLTVTCEEWVLIACTWQKVPSTGVCLAVRLTFVSPPCANPTNIW